MQRSLIIAVLILASALAYAAARPKTAQSAPCQDSCTMADMGGMKHMSGPQPDMAAMGPHMTLTPSMPARPGDAQRAAAIVSALRASIAKYQDYRVAEEDGFVPFLAGIPQPQYHFTNWRNAATAQFSFDPSRPTSLLYTKTPTGYALIGAMYTAPRSATLADLDARVPLSIAHWHEHVNFCKAPAGLGRDAYFGPDAKFGLAGSIATEDACQAAGGTFIPVLFNWMVHVYPFATSPADVWKISH